MKLQNKLQDSGTAVLTALPRSPYVDSVRGQGGGPKTAKGKAISSRNALSHGLSATAPVVRQIESTEDWERHVEAIIASKEPEGYLETELVVRVAEVLWRLRRVAHYEADKISVALDAMPGADATAARCDAQVTGRPIEELTTLEQVEMQTGIRMIPDGETLKSITRHESHLHRQLLQTLHELEAMQARRRGELAPLARLDISGPPGP